FDIFHYPGLIIPVALLAGSYFFSLYLKHLKITDLELLDDWSRAVCFMLIIYHLGLFLDGSGYGFLTTSPLGIRFPGLSLPVYPVQLFSLLYYLVIYFLLAYLEQNYRTYDWYRANRSQAKPGFIFFSFLFFATLYQLLLLSFQPAAYHLFGFSLDWIFYLSLLLLDLFLVYRHIHAPTHRSQNPRLKKRSLSKKFSFFSLKKSASAAKKPSKKNPATSAKTPAPTFKAPKTFKNAPKATSSKKVTSA
ncbi:hypothetical protein IJI99_00600, partial [bacterium]|nr:hypothetical protein [bacterium]